MKERIKDAEALYFAYDKRTNYPYCDAEDRIWMFSKEEYALNAEDYFMQQLLLLEMKKISKEELMRTLAELHILGFSELLIDNGQYNFVLSRDDLLPPPDWSGTPEINIPITNPKLQHAIIRFFQAMYSKTYDEEKKPFLQSLENRMLGEVIRAKYLLPMQLREQEPSPEEQGVRTLKEGTTIQFAVLGAEDDTAWLPAFTDWPEFEKAYDKNVWSSNVVTYDDLIALSENMSGIVINCKGVPLQLNDNNKKMIEDYRKERDNPRTDSVDKVTVQKDTKIWLGEPKEYPENMIEAVKAYMRTQKPIRKAYLQLMIAHAEQSFLLIVDADTDQETLFNGIAAAANPHLNGMVLHLASIGDWAEHIKSVEPFYKKKRFGLF